eukprot:590358-Pyramimonas_sp.AAC.1
MLEVHPSDQKKYRGRGSLGELTRRPEAQGAHFVSSRGPVAHWWARIDFSLADLVGLLDKRGSSKACRLGERLRD